MKKTSIGIRVTPHVSYYCVSSVNEHEDINIDIIDELIVPKSLSFPEQLKFLRNTFLDILSESKITVACLRITEHIASSDERRVGIEAVIQELFASSEIKSYYTGAISSIASKLGIATDQFKPAVAGEDILGIEDWKTFSKETREAILASISALKL